MGLFGPGLGGVMAVLLAAPVVAADTVDLCQGLPECAIHAQWPAGRNTAGQAMRVVETRRPARNAYEMECIEGAREFWLLTDAAAATPARRILRLCNDGYGASGIGEDSIDVSDGLLTHTRYGGSNWRAHTETEISLDPLLIRQVQTDRSVGTAVGCQRSRVDVHGARRSSWLEPVLVDEDATRGDCEFPRPADSLDIPQLNSAFSDEPAQARLQKDFEAWIAAQHSLGSCALEFGSDPLPAAHVLHGKPDQAVRLRVLALDEVHWIIGVHAPGRDPQVTRRKWIHEDRLELWLGSFLFTWPEDIQAPVQYGLTLADGAVHRGAGVDATTALPIVKHWTRDDWRWYAIDFSPVRPDWHVFSATVVYGEGDGRSQGVMLANSRLQFAKASTLGGLWEDYPYHCELREGVLERAALKPEFANPDHLDPLAETP